MKNTPSEIAAIDRNAIIQATPDAKDHPMGIGIVSEKHSWGVVVQFIGIAGTYRLPWQFIEPTGGSVVFGPDGAPLAAPKPGKHHP